MKTLEELDKLDSVITTVKSSDATFYKSTKNAIHPTFINSIFGNNGAGKSTFAKSITKKENIVCKNGINIDDYDIKIYNEEFVNNTISNAINPSSPNKELPGIFTISEGNNKIEKEIAALKIANKNLKQENGKILDKIEKEETEFLKLKDDTYKILYDKAQNFRNSYPYALTGRKQKNSFCEWIIDETDPVQFDDKDYRKKYELAFNANGKKYEPIKIPKFVIPSCDLLQEPILNSSTSDFALFMKQINAVNWVKTGHDEYHDKCKNLCPYCQQTLPANFEKTLKESFDDNYEKSINILKNYANEYTHNSLVYFTALNGIKANDYFNDNSYLIETYQKLIDNLENANNSNIQIITEKIAHPESKKELINIDDIQNDLLNFIANINKAIEENNRIIDNRKAESEKCKTDLRKHIAFMLKTEIATYKGKKSIIEKTISSNNEEKKRNDKQIDTNKTKVSALRKQITNVTSSIESINRLLANSGFTSFSIKESETKPNYYQIIRSDGSPAYNLSEGERNFIAFLYFYQQIMGSNSEEDVKYQKIIVIDDPVSSMDSSALFIVSSLIRQLFTLCPSHYKYDKNNSIEVSQIFVLTHNALFHHYVTFGYDDTDYYPYFSFFEIKKNNEISNIDISLTYKNEVPYNRNPQKNYYSSLWDAYNEVDSSHTLIILMRQIINSYFIQTCGKTEEDIHDELFIKNKELFVEDDDTSNLDLLRLIVSFIEAPGGMFQDDLSSTSTNLDLTQCKKVFKTIFKALEQEQHYNQMMKNAKEREKTAN